MAGQDQKLCKKTCSKHSMMHSLALALARWLHNFPGVISETGWKTCYCYSRATFQTVGSLFFFSDLLFPKGRGVKLPTRGPLQGRILDLFLNLRVIF